MSPVVAATECMPRRKANASTGVIVNTNGSIRARLAAPPMPGRSPTTKPVPMPTSMRLKAFHWRTRTSPSTKASSIFASPGPVYTTGNAGGKWRPPWHRAAREVVRGQAELVVHQISEILAVAGVTLVGPLPAALQKVTTYAAGLATRSAAPGPARALIAYLARPALKAKLAAAGLDYRE